MSFVLVTQDGSATLRRTEQHYLVEMGTIPNATVLMPNPKVDVRTPRTYSKYARNHLQQPVAPVNNHDPVLMLLALRQQFVNHQRYHRSPYRFLYHIGVDGINHKNYTHESPELTHS